MQQKLIEILAAATDWMTAAEIAGKGGWRSAANVGVALQQMEKADGRVESRKSDKKKQGNGMPATEWKLTEKTFDGDTKPVVRNSRTTEAPAHDAAQTETNLRQQIAHLNDELAGEKSNVKFVREQLRLAEQQRDEHFAEAEAAKKKAADLEDDVRRHVESNNRLSTAIIHFLASTQQLTGMEHKPSNMQEAEEQIAAAFNLMRGRVEELELAVDVAQQAVASMELSEEQAANDAVNVKDAAVGYLVRVPGKKTRICIKPDNARNVALSAARTHGRADVLALVPVGKAVKGAEWKDAA